MSAKNNLIRRILWVMVGNAVLGVGIGLLRLSGFGTDPFTSMNLGISSHLPISYGTYQMLVNMVLIIPIFFLDRKSFGIGALINMLLLGYIVDGWLFIFGLGGITTEGLVGNLAVRVLLMAAGILILCFGCALYMQCDLGAAPWDRLGILIERYTGGKVKYKWARMGYDCLAVVIGFLSGAVVGVATVIVGFFTGPLVSLFRGTVAVKLVGEINEVPRQE